MESKKARLQTSIEIDATPTILLVDDEENVLKSLRRVLRAEGYRILTCPDGPSALDTLSREPVHLIVSDHRMSPMNGIEFLEKAKAMKPKVIRILLTGYGDLATAEDAINRVEIYRFLTKPWNDADLKSTIKQGLRKFRLEHDNKILMRRLEKSNSDLKRWNQNLEDIVQKRTQQLREAQGNMIQAEKMASLGIMAGGVAHEINNPLGGILGITQVLLTEVESGSQIHEDLTVIEEAVKHCSGIVKNLLAFSRKSDQGACESAYLPELVDSVLTLVGHMFRDGRIQVEKRFAEDFPELKVNSKQVRQVMLNLLVNACQAMEGEGKVAVRTVVRRSGEPVVEVIDSGPGIDESVKDKIFDPFFTTKPEGEGTGLGLSVCYRIMEEHGGRIEVSSEQGKGACFAMVFPPSLVTDGRGKQDAGFEEFGRGLCAS